MVQVAITQSSLRFSTIKLISILAATLSIILNFTNWNNLEEITYLFFFTDSLIQVKAQEINMFSLKKMSMLFQNQIWWFSIPLFNI